jgi:hypothetical protein
MSCFIGWLVGHTEGAPFCREAIQWLVELGLKGRGDSRMPDFRWNRFKTICSVVFGVAFLLLLIFELFSALNGYKQSNQGRSPPITGSKQ